MRNVSTRLRSRNVSTPPIIRPDLSFSKAVLTLIGISLPSARRITTGLLTTGFFVSIVDFRAQVDSQMLARKTSQQGRPIASDAETPVIFSAARLKNVIRHSGSTVNTPSAMLFKIISVCGDKVDSTRLSL